MNPSSRGSRFSYRVIATVMIPAAVMAVFFMLAGPALAVSPKVFAGDDSSFKITPAGSLGAWGYYHYGRAEDGTYADRKYPAAVGTASYSAVEYSDEYALAIKSDGSLWAWGQNRYGQFGNGTTSTTVSDYPAAVGTGSFSAIAAGYDHSLAIKSDGSLWAWGQNIFGRLGDGTVSDSYLPAPVAATGSFSAIVADYLHNLALKTDGSLWAWSQNSFGQLGDGTVSDSYLPAPVAATGSFSAIAAGHDHSLALKTDGSLWAWGRNVYGQLGDGTLSDSYLPAPVAATGSFSAVAAGYGHSLAIKSDGSLWSWGENSMYGMLGNGTVSDSYTPAPVADAGPFNAVDAGTYHSLAIKSDGSLWAWGKNSFGQLGDGTFSNSYTPALVLPLPPGPDDGISGPQNDTTPTFTWVAPFDAASYEYRIDEGSASATTAFTVTLDPQADGTFAFSIRTVDTAGTRSKWGTHSYIVDTTPPPVPAEPDDYRSTPTTGHTMLFYFNVVDGAIGYEWRVDDGVPSTSYHDMNGTNLYATSSYAGEGTHAFSVRSYDLVGNRSAWSTHFYAIDTTPPAVPAPDDGTDIPMSQVYPNWSRTFTWPAIADAYVYEYRIDGASANETYVTSSFVSWSQISVDGPHTFAVRARDNAGNWSAYGTHAFTYDTTKPAPPTLVQPPSPTGSSSIVLRGTAEPNSTVKFEYNHAAVYPTVAVSAGGTYAYTITGIGEYEDNLFTAYAGDATGNWSDVSNTVTVAVDLTAPGAPTWYMWYDDNWTSSFVTITGNAAEYGINTIEYLDSGSLISTGYTAADSTFALRLTLVDGTHYLQARTYDAVGHVSPLSRTATVSVDTVPPTIALSQPASPASENNLDVSGHASEPGCYINFYKDGEQYGTTTADGSGNFSAYYYFYADEQGSHTLTAMATDPAGNASVISNAVSYLLDTVPPDSPIATPEPGIYNHDVTVSLSVEAGAHIHYTADAEWPDATSPIYSGPIPVTSSVALYVMAHDATGNESLPEYMAYTVDKWAPQPPTPSDGITGPSRDNTPTFTWAYDVWNDPDGYEWRVDTSAATQTLTTAVTLAAQSDGKHLFYLRSYDAAGNYSAWATHAFTIDTRVPSLSLTKPLAGAWVRGSVPVAATAGDGSGGSGIARVEFWFNGVKKLTDTASPYSASIATGTASGNKVFKVIAYDKAGNAKTYSRTITVDNYKPRAAYSTTWLYWKRGGNIKFKTYEFRASPLVAVTATSRIYLGTRLIRSLPAKTVYANSAGYAGYVVWNARNAAGAYVAKGRYIVKTTLKDRAGNTNISSGYLTIR